MNDATRKALEADGWRFGDAADFLEMTEAERKILEMRIALSRAIKARRTLQKITQEAAAKQMDTSQARFAKIEAGTRGVSLDQMFKGLFSLGGSLDDIIRPKPKAPRQKSVKLAPPGGTIGPVAKATKIVTGGKTPKRAAKGPSER